MELWLRPVLMMRRIMLYPRVLLHDNEYQFIENMYSSDRSHPTSEMSTTQHLVPLAIIAVFQIRVAWSFHSLMDNIMAEGVRSPFSFPPIKLFIPTYDLYYVGNLHVHIISSTPPLVRFIGNLWQCSLLINVGRRLA